MTGTLFFRTSLSIFVLTCNFLFAFPLTAAESDEIQASILEELGYSSTAPFLLNPETVFPKSTSSSISSVYIENGFEPIWVTPKGPTEKASILFDILKSAKTEGLNTGDYRLDRIESKLDTLDSKNLASLDIMLTTALHDYVSDLREGRSDPCQKDPYLFTCARDRIIDPVDLAVQAMSADNFKLFIEKQAPDSSQYRHLRTALKRYMEIEQKGGWKRIPDGPVLKKGMFDQRLPAVMSRLAATGLLTHQTSSEILLNYDEETEQAVMLFQETHGLEVDGIIGKNTLMAMNMPVSSIIAKIVINMERLRWLSRGAGDFYIIVNIASFKLSVVENSETVMELPVIVGKHYRETPVFSDVITYMEFNPFWNIPPSIARRDILPKLKKNPAYLTEMGIHVFDGWGVDAKEIGPALIQWGKITPRQMGTFKLRQDPGPKNLLGRVKFMFPNRFSVYLHDTPSQDLFSHNVRTFSSGCIRLSRPLKLADYLLKRDQNDAEIIKPERIVGNGSRTIVTLRTPVPIHIVYLTSYADSGGIIHFKNDIYGRDKLLEQALSS